MSIRDPGRPVGVTARGTIHGMIKTLIILILAVALTAGAFLSRPSPSDFKPFIKQKLEQQSGGFFEKTLADVRADSFVKSCTIKDRYLWVTVERDGKPIYTGAFSHWWGGDDTRPK